LVPLALLAACGKNPYEARIEGVLLADADGVVAAEEAPLVKLTHEDPEPALPDAPAARLAVVWDMPWSEVVRTLDRFGDKQIRPILLVGKRQDVRAFVLSDELKGPPILVTAFADGKVCVGPPDSEEAICVTSTDHTHIGKAHVREYVREAAEAYGLNDVEVVIGDPQTDWIDVVRTIDGARTCCDERAMRVKLQR
jgi:hypothetical protein